MSSLLGPVTDADLRRWQRRRLDLLAELIRAQDERGLTPLAWTLAVHALVGKVTGDHPTEIRETFDAWVIALGLGRQPETHHDIGRVHLRAATDDLWGRGVGVVVIADLWEDHPAE
jgi:hypothetical protein